MGTTPTDVQSVDSVKWFTLTDISKMWMIDEWAPGVVRIRSGTGAGQVYRIIDNTPVMIEIAYSWLTKPTGSEYDVLNASTWTEINDVSDDNKNADGETNITWDLE